MKSWLAVLLTLALCLSMAACGDTGISSTGAAEETIEVEIPAAVLNLTEEDNALLNGELKDGVYTNQYFGIRFTTPEGWSISRLNDDAADTSQILSMRQAYEEEMGGISFMASPEAFGQYIILRIRALRDDELGLCEEELVKRNNERIWEINKLLGEDRGPELGVATFAGEEHPMGIQLSETKEGENLFVSFYLPKGDFVCDISITTPNGTLEEMTAHFGKL